MDRTTELHYLISGNNQFGRVNLSRAAAGAAVKKAKELLQEGYLDVRISTPRGRMLLSDEFDQLRSAHKRCGRQAMSVRAFKTADELQDMIVAQARTLHGPWPSGMTMFVFDDAYGWSASISRPMSEADNFYRTRTLDLIRTLKVSYDLDAPHL